MKGWHKAHFQIYLYINSKPKTYGIFSVVLLKMRVGHLVLRLTHVTYKCVWYLLAELQLSHLLENIQHFFGPSNKTRKNKQR